MHDDPAAGGATLTMSYLPRTSMGSTFRRLYSLAANAEAFIPGGELIDVVRAELLVASAPAGQPLDRLIGDTVAWSSAAAEQFEALGHLADRDGRGRLMRRAALGWAPLGLASGAWLQWLTHPGTADLPLYLQILELYAADVGAGHAGGARGNAYLGLLRLLRAGEDAMPLARLAGDLRIDDAAFRVPALLLLMSRRPGDFCQELIGADLCLRAVGLPPPLALGKREVVADWAAIDYSGAREGRSPTEQCKAIADALVREGTESAARMYAGFGWTLAAMRDQTEALHDQLRASLDPGYDMAELITLRSRQGSVYHHRFLLEGRPLAAWLNDCREDPQPLLDVLARSKLIRPGRSGASPLVTELVSERGPMFRVFSPDDLAIIRRWIDALPAGRRPGEAAGADGTVSIRTAAEAPEEGRLAVLPDLLETSAPPSRRPRDLREAYHLLLAGTCDPELRDWCLRYVTGWLGRTRHRMGSRSIPLPVAWTTKGLRPWLQTQHDQNGAEFEGSARIPLPSREVVVDDAVQTAPLTLIDGSWLKGFTDYELASSDIGYLLFATFWDELGNGEPKLNHPLIYREVLKEMDVDLPPTTSPEFARWPGFRDASFELPVYWLCIGRFPRTFLPEVLGLNLAMELSGVGGTYRRASMALRSYGFSTRFVDIHNTIDNVATGHAAWAADAVDTLMASLPDSSGSGSQSEVWERVRAGYRSLNPPSGLRARRAAHRGRLAGSRWQLAKAAMPVGEKFSGV